MSDYGDDAGRCSNGLSAQKFRDATSEERAVYRRWIHGAIALYTTVLLTIGTFAWFSHAVVGTIEMTNLVETGPSATPLHKNGRD